MSRPAALFVTTDSVYKTLPCDAWDKERDALKWPGGAPVVAHPPCRTWASLRHCTKAPLEERQLALWAVQQVRRWGGVLEHPLFSVLWREAGYPRVGGPDAFGGYSLIVDQFWFGHRAQKRTRLYVCGCGPNDVPPMPIKLGEAPCTVGLWSKRDRATCRPSIAKREFEATPPDFAAWLLEIARRCRPAAMAA